MIIQGMKEQESRAPMDIEFSKALLEHLLELKMMIMIIITPEVHQILPIQRLHTLGLKEE